jgi:branched-chain amino acid transport system substrate-binding protein
MPARRGGAGFRVVVKEVSYQVSESTVEYQVVTLESVGVDIFLIASSPRFAAQAIRKTFDIGWAALR